jgi:hypothetical protein
VPGLSGGGAAEASVAVGFEGVRREGAGVFGVVICGVVGVRIIGEGCVKIRGGSSASVAVTASSGEGSVEMAGSVPRKIYLNGVFVTVTSITTREVL